MNPSEREQVVELLEVAHGYAIAGSIMPFRTACIDTKTHDSDIAGAAAEFIDRACKDLGLPNKPARERYADAIALALTRVEEME